MFKKSGSNPGPPPTQTPLAITSINVNTGPFNTVVIVTGTGFSSTLADDQVFFNSKTATISNATSTQLTVVVPLGASTGNVTVSVNNGKAAIGPVFNYQLTAMVTTIAGNIQGGAIDGNGAKASFRAPFDVTVDSKGFIYVADHGNNLIREISPTYDVTTLAGNNGSALGINGQGTAASFDYPTGILVDASGNMYVADNTALRQIMPGGSVITVGYAQPVEYSNIASVVTDALNNIFVSDIYNNVIIKISPRTFGSVFAGAPFKAGGAADGTSTLALFNHPVALAIDTVGNLYSTDQGSNLIRKISPLGTVTTIAGSGQAVLVNGQGRNASFNSPSGIAIDVSGNLYIGDSGNNVIRKITPGGTVSTVAGTGFAGSADGEGSSATFNHPQGLAIDPSGNIYVADTNNNLIRKISFQ